MTLLIPTTAPWLHIQSLPQNYQLASGSYYHNSQIQRVRIAAWMPDKFGYCETEEKDDEDAEDRFRQDNCHSCDYYFDSQEGDASGITDNDGNLILSCRVTSCCPCYEEGVYAVNFPCKAGEDSPYNSGQGAFPLPPMAFTTDLHLVSLRPRSFSAWVQAVSLDDTGIWRCTDQWRGINIHESHDVVCWGNENSNPASLPEAVATYCDAPANEDLLSVNGFIHNIHQVRRATPVHAVNGALVGPGYDALLVATATATSSAFLLLSASGVPSTDGLIVLGLTSCTHTFEDGTEVAAYLTDPVIAGRSWLLISNPAALEEGGEAFDNQGLLLGQIQSTTKSPTCDSPAPSSLAPAELAAC
jgi:hypothetical protein